MMFDQTEFIDAAYTTVTAGLNQDGYVYIPNSCKSVDTPTCRIHVAMHGCGQSKVQLEDHYAKNTGYLEHAASNNMIILFPQTSSNLDPFNSNGCWDFWGYTGENYYNNQGVQPSTIMKMIARLTSKPTETKEVPTTDPVIIQQ